MYTRKLELGRYGKVGRYRYLHTYPDTVLPRYPDLAPAFLNQAEKMAEKMALQIVNKYLLAGIPVFSRYRTA